jgi:branched-chain amino acid transport system substrate-binding protein
LVNLASHSSGNCSFSPYEDPLGKPQHHQSSTVVLGRKIQLKIFDTQGDPTKARALIRDIRAAQVQAVVGFHSSNDALAIVPALDRLKIPVVVASSTHPKILDSKHFTVQTGLDDESQAQALSQKLLSMGKRRVILVTDVNATFTLSFSSFFEKDYQDQGGTIVESLETDIENISFKEVAKKIAKQAHLADALVISAPALETVYLWSSLREYPLKIDLIGNDGLQSENLKTLIRGFKTPFHVRLFFSHWDPFSKNSIQSRFFEDYRKAYPSHPLSPYEIAPLLTYDSAVLLFRALEKSKSEDPDDWVKALKSMRMTGVSGDLSFKSNGASHKKPIFLGIRAGELIRGN